MITVNDKAVQFIEVKLSNKEPSSSLKYFSKRFDNAEFIQLVHNLHNEEDNENIQIRRAGEWLRELEV